MNIGLFKLNNKTTVMLLLLCFLYTNTFGQNSVREVKTLKSDWYFHKGDIAGATKSKLDESKWQKISIPHDWAISGPFNKNNDLQKTTVIEDGENKSNEKTGRTGGLPYEGIGWYRKQLMFDLADKHKTFSLEFDGAMSHARVYLNDKLVGQWPYGYSSFSFDITKYIIWGKSNVLAVKLENKWESSRWYPGAGIYRNVRLVKTNPLHIAHWGTLIRTTAITSNKAHVKIETRINNDNNYNGDLSLVTKIYDSKDKLVASIKSDKVNHQEPIIQALTIQNPELWSADSPNLYYATSSIYMGDKLMDNYKTTFGVRNIVFKPDSGMLVNGVQTKLKGVCLHSDLGALGMAMNKAALRYRLNLLKQMGCNAIRGTHNPQAPEMLELCDEMGFYFIDEAFDEWKSPKLENGYHLLFDDWAKKDLQAMIYRDRNHPALIMYSIGNEIREQNEPEGYKVAQYLADICHKTDSTRPVTAALNQWDVAIKNGLADALDIPGWNYKPQFYEKIHKEHPKWVVYASETASTVSSRGAYELPAIPAAMKTREDHQSTAYDLEYCSWSQLPDMEWKSQHKNNFVAGEFVWTGFDYLGEPTPYGSLWPSRSSYFGIIDLAGIPKDRYYLYQSQWSTQKVLHILPHWNWKGQEGKVVPVYAYTNYPSAEVFINGKSYGKRTFNKDSLLSTYRLRWQNTVYQPGELKVVAYNEHGDVAETQIIKTAGEPATVKLEVDRNKLNANGNDMVFVTVSITDKDGNLCPLADNLVNFNVSGVGVLKAVDNGNPISMEPFEANSRKAFYGKCMAIIQTKDQPGQILITAYGKGLKPKTIKIESTK